MARSVNLLFVADPIKSFVFVIKQSFSWPLAFLRHIMTIQYASSWKK